VVNDDNFLNINHPLRPLSCFRTAGEVMRPAIANIATWILRLTRTMTGELEILLNIIGKDDKITYIKQVREYV